MCFLLYVDRRWWVNGARQGSNYGSKSWVFHPCLSCREVYSVSYPHTPTQHFATMSLSLADPPPPRHTQDSLKPFFIEYSSSRSLFLYVFSSSSWVCLSRVFLFFFLFSDIQRSTSCHVAASLEQLLEAVYNDVMPALSCSASTRFSPRVSSLRVPRSLQCACVCITRT